MRAIQALVLFFVALRLDGASLPEVSLGSRNGVLRLAVTGDTGSGADNLSMRRAVGGQGA